MQPDKNPKVEKLNVRCKLCGHEYPSRLIQMPKSAFATSVLANNTEPCPKCGKPSTYNKADYFFK